MTAKSAPAPVPTATVEGLLLLKLCALPSLYRLGDLTRVRIYEGDIATLMQAYSPGMGPLHAELARHLSTTDLLEVKAISAEIQERIDRFGQRFQNLDQKDD